jgi:hypothetical protein
MSAIVSEMRDEKEKRASLGKSQENAKPGVN